MQARFDFAGSLIPPHEDLPTHLGLHHHGEEPEVIVWGGLAYLTNNPL